MLQPRTVLESIHLDEARFLANPQDSRPLEGLLGNDAHTMTQVVERVGKGGDSDSYFLGSLKVPNHLPLTSPLPPTQTDADFPRGWPLP